MSSLAVKTFPSKVTSHSMTLCRYENKQIWTGVPTSERLLWSVYLSSCVCELGYRLKLFSQACASFKLCLCKFFIIYFCIALGFYYIDNFFRSVSMMYYISFIHFDDTCIYYHCLSSHICCSCLLFIYFLQAINGSLNTKYFTIKSLGSS